MATKEDNKITFQFVPGSKELQEMYR